MKIMKILKMFLIFFFKKFLKNISFKKEFISISTSAKKIAKLFFITIFRLKSIKVKPKIFFKKKPKIE